MEDDDTELVELANNNGPDVITVERWDTPEENDTRILTMPNVPYPCHLLAPRTLLGSSTWNAMRKSCYVTANYTCEVCGEQPSATRAIHAHEVYTIDYATQTVKFERCVCLCKKTHIQSIHTGRALTMYKKGSPLMTKEMLLEGAEHAYSLVHKWNLEHPDEEPLRLFSAWLDYEKQPELKDKMVELRTKYDIKFYRVSEKWYKKKYWSNWKLIIGNREYPTPYADKEAWAAAMEENNNKRRAEIETPFKGEMYTEIDNILKGDFQ